jgi:hypothetical protein
VDVEVGFFAFAAAAFAFAPELFSHRRADRQVAEDRAAFVLVAPGPWH